MIVDAIVSILMAIFTGILGLLPTFDYPAELTTGASGLGAPLATANAFFPVTTLGVCLGIIFAARVFVFGWAFLVWLYDRIPFKAT